MSSFDLVVGLPGHPPVDLGAGPLGGLLVVDEPDPDAGVPRQRVEETKVVT